MRALTSSYSKNYPVAKIDAIYAIRGKNSPVAKKAYICVL